MPDFERLTDSLRERLAADARTAWVGERLQAGKKRSRIEVLVIVVALYFIVALDWKLASA